jgi:hypothetical protein
MAPEADSKSMHKNAVVTRAENGTLALSKINNLAYTRRAVIRLEIVTM